MARPAFPKTLREFQLTFADEDACAFYLAACRWPDGFRCPRCGHHRAHALTTARLWQCGAASCRYQTSLTSGTVLHRSKTPLTTWFWAAYLMTTDKRGVSALLLQHQLGVFYKTAWLLLHKLRRAMVVRTRETLRGVIEMDETWVGGLQTGLKGSRQLKGRKVSAGSNFRPTSTSLCSDTTGAATLRRPSRPFWGWARTGSPHRCRSFVGRPTCPTSRSGSSAPVAR